MKKRKSSKSGVALLMSLGLLALLSVLGIAFATNMRLMERTTRDFIYEVQARYLAEAGVQYAIAVLKQDARTKFVFNGVNPTGTGADKDKLILLPPPSGQASLPTGNSIEIKAIDTARQVNINGASKNLLDCLPGIGYDSTNDTGLAKDIDDKRGKLPGKMFLTKQSICLTSGIGPVTYEKIKDYISTYSYADPNVQDSAGNVVGVNNARSAMNINTLGEDTNSETMLSGVLQKIDNVATDTAGNIISTLRGNSDKPIKSWSQFNGLVEAAVSDTDTRENIENMFNPNKKKPQMTGQNKGIPTEFCFHSGGTYELTVTGTIKKSGYQVASKTISTVVKIFDINNITTMEQFQGDLDVNYDGMPDGDTNNDGVIAAPDYGRVTWLDSCPVNIRECYDKKYISGDAVTAPDSLKMGFWEDFDFWDNNGNLIQDRWDYSVAQWYPILGYFYVKKSGLLNKSVRSVWRGTENIPGLFFVGLPGGVRNYPILALGRLSSVSSAVNNRWKWYSFSSRLYLRSYSDQYTSGAETIVDRNPVYTVDYRYLAGWESGSKLARKYDVGAHIFLKRNSDMSGSAGQRDVYINHMDPWQWDREATDEEKVGTSCGRWDLKDGIYTNPGRWRANENLNGEWGNTYICSLDGGHESVKPSDQADAEWTQNNDWNKNPDDTKENDDKTKNNPNPPTGPYVQDNIESAWSNICYDPRAFPKNSYMCIKGIPEKMIDGKYAEDENDSGKLDRYYEAGDYFVLCNVANNEDIISVKASLYNYDPNDNEKLLNQSYKEKLNVDCGGRMFSGLFALYAANFAFIAKNIRIIGQNGFYESPYFMVDNNKDGIPDISVEFGSIWGTKTIPKNKDGVTPAADLTKNKTAFQVKVDDSTTWFPDITDVPDSNGWKDGVPDCADIETSLMPTTGGGIGKVGGKLKYKAVFTTSSPDFSETPVLEDIWLTYMSKTKILYWKEG